MAERDRDGGLSAEDRRAVYCSIGQGKRSCADTGKLAFWGCVAVAAMVVAAVLASRARGDDGGAAVALLAEQEVRSMAERDERSRSGRVGGSAAAVPGEAWAPVWLGQDRRSGGAAGSSGSGGQGDFWNRAKSVGGGLGDAHTSASEKLEFFSWHPRVTPLNFSDNFRTEPWSEIAAIAVCLAALRSVALLSRSARRSRRPK